MIFVPGGLDPGRSTPSRVGTPLWNSPVRGNGLARCESTAVSGGVDGELVVFWCVVNILFVLWLSEPVVSLSNATTSYFVLYYLICIMAKWAESIDKFAEGGDFCGWLRRLELIAEVTDATDKLPSAMPMLLKGAAFAVYEQLPADVRKDYTKLKLAMTETFAEDCFQAWKLLTERIMQPGEKVDVFLADLIKLFGLVGHTDPPEAALRCAFINGLPAYAKQQLVATPDIRKMPMSTLLPVARAILSSSTATFPSVCAVGQHSVDRPTHVGKKVKPGSGCFRCGKMGHIARECPNSKTDTCYRCGEPGHVSRDCLAPTPRRGNELVEASLAPVPSTK